MAALVCKLCQKDATVLTDKVCNTCMGETFAPIVHMNGTSKESLLENLDAVYDAITVAYKKLKQAAPNQRDYYISRDARHWDKALWQHRKRMELMDALRQSIQKEMELIDAQTR